MTDTPRLLLRRVAEEPNLARAVPLLPPAVLHAAVRRLGLDQCTEILALATPAQISAVFDLDLWRAERPGGDDGFDAARFCEWLEAMVDADVDAAADRLAELEGSLMVAALARYVAVFDPATFPSEVPSMSSHIGGYVVVQRRHEHWDAIGALLGTLEERHRDAFHRVMQGCRRLSNSAPEADGFHDLLDAPEQARFDLGLEREGRLADAGYVTPADARAFLAGARRFDPNALAPPPNAIRIVGAGGLEPDVDAPLSADVAAVLQLLDEAGAVQLPLRALPGGAADQAPAPVRLALITAHLSALGERDAAAYVSRMQEFAFLSNVLVAGGAVQGRAFTAREAADAAAAACNLGLEYWPGGAAEDLLVTTSLGVVFERGWAVLHRDVVMFAAEQLLGALADLRTRDREIQVGLHALSAQLTRHWRAGMPWLAHEAMEALALLDLPTWAALRALINECPVLLANVSGAGTSGVRAVDPGVFEFISERRQIESVRAFLGSLIERLTC